MEKEFWLQKWQSQDIGFHQPDVNAELITYAPKLHLQSEQSILVPLCGKTRDMLWLADQGYNVIGIEVSPIACHDFFAHLAITPHLTREARYARYSHSNITLLCGDLFDLQASDLPSIQAVYDCKALIALPPAMRKKYVNRLIDCLGIKISILLLTRETNCEVQPPPFSVTTAEINSLYGSCFHVEQLQNKSITDIPERLRKKGYTDMQENVYIISPKNESA